MGFTLIELIVSIGLFALVMTLASGAYLLMIGINRQVQGMATGIDNLSFALEDMTRSIRTGSNYSCNGVGDCASGGTSFSFQDPTGAHVTYGLSGGSITKSINSGTANALTDPSIVISSLIFYVTGTSNTDIIQSNVKIVVSGTVSDGAGKTESFTVETGATMRGTDI